MTGRRDCACPRARHQHGTRTAYDRDRCRCFACRVANSQAKSRYACGGVWRESRKSPIGTQRRLQALQAIGWTWTALGVELGLSRQAVFTIAGGRERSCAFATTEARVVEIYNKLWNVRPTGVAADRARLRAARKGWKPPMFWDDDTIDLPSVADFTYSLRKNRTMSSRDSVAVAEVVAGRNVPLTRDEVSEAVRRMTDMNYTARQIAERLGVAPRSVVRYRAAIRKRDAA